MSFLVFFHDFSLICRASKGEGEAESDQALFTNKSRSNFAVYECCNDVTL